MEFLFAIWAVVWIAFNLPVPPPSTSIGVARLIIGLVGIILIVLLLLGALSGHRVSG